MTYHLLIEMIRRLVVHGLRIHSMGFTAYGYSTQFQGRGQFGFDPIKKKYVGTWIDSMSTILSVLEGEYDSKTKTMIYVGGGYDPARKSKFTQKMVTTMKDDGTRVFSLYMKYEGEPAEVKFMEIT
jgi:uncharacterized protein DUF1579